MVRLSTVPAPLLRSAILVTAAAGLLAALGSAEIQNAGPAPGQDISAPAVSTEQQLAEAPQPTAVRDDDLDQTKAAIAELSLAGALADASIIWNRPKLVVETARTDSPAVMPTEPAPVQVAAPVQVVAPLQVAAPVQIAMVNPSDLESRDAGKAATSIEAVGSIEIVDECLVVEVCVDRYLWALYQRTPKEDTIKEHEQRKVTVKRRGKMVTVTRTFTKLVDEDFGWKDPKAAERVRMSMMDYVIGGMDRSFKLKLFHLLHRAEAEGLSPGITSAFRDDYRQAIASGLKAASNRSFHGGSLRGGYGRGLAADIVSVQGGTRDQRWVASEKLWKWVDARGKEFGIGRPYLGRDPPHVGPVDGQEYAAHNRGSKQAVSDVKKVKRVATRHDPVLAKRPRVAAASKMGTS